MHSSRLRIRFLVLAIASTTMGILTPGFAQAPTDALANVRGLKCRRTESAVSVSFRIEGALANEDRGDIESGIAIALTHTLNVVRRRKLVFDKSLARATVETSARLDTLTKQYTLTRKVDGITVETSTTDRPDAMERWLTEIRDLDIALPPESDKGTLEVRVNSEYRKTFLLFLFPWPLSAKGEAECR